MFRRSPEDRVAHAITRALVQATPDENLTAGQELVIDPFTAGPRPNLLRTYRIVPADQASCAHDDPPTAP